jgi:hypothetical protein
MPATTVLQFVTLQNGNLNTALLTAQSTLTAKQTAYTAAQTALGALQTQLAAIAADMTSIRNQLAGTVTPEDGAALLAKLAADQTSSRQTTGAIAIAQRKLALAKADSDVAASEAQRITAALAASTTALQDAQAQDQRRSSLKAALGTPPLSTIVTDAAALAASATFTAAQARIVADLPAPLVTEAEARLSDETTRATASSNEALQAQQLVETQWTTDGGLAGAVLALQGAFQRADAAFTAYVTTAGNRLSQASAALANVADPTYSPLSPAQKAGINDDSAKVVTNAEAAAVLEKGVDDAVLAVAQMQAILDEKRREAIQANVDADPSTNAAVVTATTNLTNAQTALTAAKTAYTTALQQQTTTWEVLVPDSEWQLLSTFEYAKATLAWLQNPGPTALQTAMDAAELALTNALLAADKSTRTIAALKAAAAKWAAVAQYETTAADGRRFSALRGDF